MARRASFVRNQGRFPSYSGSSPLVANLEVPASSTVPRSHSVVRAKSCHDMCHDMCSSLETNCWQALGARCVVRISHNDVSDAKSSSRPAGKAMRSLSIMFLIHHDAGGDEQGTSDIERGLYTHIPGIMMELQEKHAG